jgi:hypothetical protein
MRTSNPLGLDLELKHAVALTKALMRAGMRTSNPLGLDLPPLIWKRFLGEQVGISDLVLTLLALLVQKYKCWRTDVRQAGVDERFVRAPCADVC